MPSTITVGAHVKASIDILLNKNNIHVTLLSSAGPPIIKKGTEAEITSVNPTHIELNCKDGPGPGIHAWGLKIKIARVVFGVSFE